MAANAGLTVEQYRAREEEKARKAEETAKTYALQAKIDTCKSTINFYDEKSRRAAWYLYNAVIKGDEDQATFIANDIAEFENKIAEAKKELADLEPATEDTEVKAEDDNSNSIKTKKARKLYRMNPVYKEDENPRYNVVDIFIENGVLKISGLFECWKPETAYRRFRKIMAQAATEVPELDGWDNWEPAQKLTFDEDEKIWLNQNGDVIFDTKYVADRLNIDINEDSIYIWGTFYTTAEAYRAAHPEEPNCNLEATAETDGSEEEEDDENFTANVMPAVDDDTDDELIDEAEDNVADKCTDSGRVQATGGVSSTANDISTRPRQNRFYAP